VRKLFLRLPAKRVRLCGEQLRVRLLCAGSFAWEMIF
jgi:hypothetical protein